MLQFLEFTFQSFWHFIGVIIILNGLSYFITTMTVKMWKITIRGNNIRKYGWPPEHLDADGDHVEYIELKKLKAEIEARED